MLRHKIAPLFLIALLLAWTPRAQGGAPLKGARYQAGELIVRFRPGAEPADATAPTVAKAGGKTAAGPLKAAEFSNARRPESLKRLERRHRVREGRPLAQGGGLTAAARARTGGSAKGAAALEGAWLLRLDPAADLEQTLKDYRSDPAVLYAEPNYIGSMAYVPSDPLYPQTSATLRQIGMEQAWGVQPGATNATVNVAVIDSGVDAMHPDLVKAVDLANSYNFTDNNQHIFDDLGHGTRVAGIIGASANNRIGIAGVAFGCRLMSLDVITSTGLVTVADVAKAIDWALQRGADLINISICFRAYSVTLDGACRDAAGMGVLVVAAAGNENQGDFAVYPAAHDGVLGVGAVDASGARASWSNYSGACSTLVDLVAPGDKIFSTIPNGQYNGIYGSGTSFAAPLVTGVAALLKSRHHEQSGGALRQHLLATANPVAAGFKPQGGAGAGLLSAARALATPMQPALSIARVAVDDAKAYSALNNADGRLQKGETVRLVVHLKNSGADALASAGEMAVAATLTTTDTLVTLSDRRAQWGAILSGQTRPATDGFTSVTLAAASPAHPIAFQLHYSTDGQTTQTLNFEAPAETYAIPPNIIGANTTWGAESTWLITQPTFVMGAAKLTIQPGTTIRFEPAGRLEVRGALDAQGTAELPITFSSLKGTSDGDFKLPHSFNAGIYRTQDACLGDADNDGRMESVYIYPDQQRVMLCRWNGVAMDVSGTRQIPFTPASVTIADANNDGRNEVLTADTLNSKIYQIPVAKLDLGAPTPVATCPYPYWLTVDDVDNDGRNEILAVCYKNPLAKTGFRLMMLRANAAGGYGAPVELTSSDEKNFWMIRVGDADNDGKKEVLGMFADDFSPNGMPQVGRIHAWRWNGATVSEVASIYQLKNVYLAIGDADNDGKNEVVVSTQDGVHIMRLAGGQFQDKALIDNSYASWCPVLVADADNDGRNELLIAGGPDLARDNIITSYRWNGSGYGIVNIESVIFLSLRLMHGDINGDGLNDLWAAGPSQSSILLWDPEAITGPSYGGLGLAAEPKPGVWLTSAAKSATLAHCVFQFAPVLDESTTALISDCVFDRSGGDYALQSLTGANPLLRCEARGNSRGHGIVAGAKALTDCVATNNRGIGLQGGLMTNCRARGNGSIGIAGYYPGAFDWTSLLPGGDPGNAEAIACQAIGNGRTGIVVKTRAVECKSSDNSDRGIDAREVTSCTAVNNWSDGITGLTVSHSIAQLNGGKGIRTWAADAASTLSTAADCQALDNSGVGIEVYGPIDRCIAARNGGSGLRSEDAITQSLASANAGNGLDARGSLISCTSLRNALHGAVRGFFGKISNSQLLENGQCGYYTDNAPYNPAASRGALERCLVAGNKGPGVQYNVALRDCTIRDNSGPGVVNAYALTGCNIYGNGGVTGIDYREERPSQTLMQLNLSGNYWGPLTTPVMQANPWQTYFNIPAIFDFLDNTNLCEVQYDPHLVAENPQALPDTSSSGGPDASAPAYLAKVEPALDTPLNVGVATFRLTFSKPMNRQRPLAVSFGLQAPYTANIVQSVPGWVSDTVWQGSFAIQTNTADGTCTLSVNGAVDASGFALPADTAHRFVVETTGKPAANNGLAIGQGTKVKLVWKAPNGPIPGMGTIAGFNVMRSSGDLPDEFTHPVNDALVPASAHDAQGNYECYDADVEPFTTYFYLIYLVDADMNAVQYGAPIKFTTGDLIEEPPPVERNAVSDWTAYR